jgi:hypothetical protein
MAHDTALNIINDALLELGVVSSAVATPYLSSDANVILMRSLLKAMGRRWARSFQWSDLQKTHTFVTVNGTASYSLPADLHRLLNSTEWNRTTEQRLLGPLAAQGWQLLQSTSAVAGITYWYRKVGDKLHVYPTPTAAETLAFEYQSTYWVMPSGQTTPTADAPTTHTDTLWFDGPLMVAGLKVAWRKHKRLDVATEQEEFDELWAAATGGDTPAPDIHLGVQGGVAMITTANLPETGYGS